MTGAWFTRMVLEAQAVEPRNGKIRIELDGLESRRPEGTTAKGAPTTGAIEILPLKEQTR